MRRFFTSLIVLFALAASVTHEQAGAYRIVSTSGAPGKLNGKKILGYNSAGEASYITWPGGSIERSPLASAGNKRQTICSTYRIYEFNYTDGFWHLRKTWPRPTYCYFVDPGRQLNLSSLVHHTVPFGLYRGTWEITWILDGKRIGYDLVKYYDQGDYACRTTKCEISESADGETWHLFFPPP